MQIQRLGDPDENARGQAHKNAGRAESEAADLIYPKTGSMRMLALNLISKSVFGLTDTELWLVSGVVKRYSISPRRYELVQMGWVKDSGRVRPNAEGNNETVWVMTSEGRRKWAERA